MLKHLVVMSVALVGATSGALAIGGSYQESCENIQQRGPMLSAECRTADGDYRRSSIDVRGCSGGVANSNGRLTCGRRGGFNGGPRFDGGPGFDRRRGGFDGPGYDRGGPGPDERYGEPRRRFFHGPRPDDEDN